MKNTLKRSFAAEHLKRDIMKQIAEGALREGDPVLSINQMKDKYNVAKGTVEKAVKELVADGVLESIKGKGSFISSSKGFSSDSEEKRDVRLKHIGLSYSLSPFALPMIRRLEEHVMDRGGILTIYNVCPDLQSSLQERKFLENLKAAKADGVALFASPWEPLNNDLYAELRDSGIKVVLISPHQYDVSDYVCFMVDSRFSGMDVARVMAKKKYENILFLKKKNQPVFMTWLEEGLRFGAKCFGINYLDAEMSFSKKPHGYKATVENNGHLAEFCQKIPTNTGVFVPAYDDACIFYEYLKKSGRDIPGENGILAGYQRHDSIYPLLSHMSHNQEKMLIRAMDYLLDEKIDPKWNVQEWFKPEYVGGGSLKGDTVMQKKLEEVE